MSSRARNIPNQCLRIDFVGAELGIIDRLGAPAFRGLSLLGSGFVGSVSVFEDCWI